MKHSHLVAGVLAVVLLGLPLATGAGPAAPSSGAPSLVSYQGQVTVSGTPYSGTGYFKLAFVNSAGDASYWSNDGTSSGGSEPTASVALEVSNGLFSLLLGDTSLPGMTQPLTAGVFEATDRYLRVWFSTDDGTFSRLAPDRRIASVPYALQAEEAKNSSALDGLPGSAFQRHYQNVVVVAKSGGDFISIQAALDSIADAAEGNRYLVWVAPGVYHEKVTMKPYIDIEGAGQLTTKITYSGSESGDTGTVMGADNAELRNVTVENTGGAPYAIAVCNHAASPTVTNVTILASGGEENYGVHNITSSALMTDSRIIVSGDGFSEGVYNHSSSPKITGVSITATGNVGTRGIANWYDSSPVLLDVTVTATGSGSLNIGINSYGASSELTRVLVSTGGGRDNRGVSNMRKSGQGEPLPAATMTDVKVTVWGGDDSQNLGIDTDDATTMTDVTVTATGGHNSTNYGVRNLSSEDDPGTPSMIRVTSTASGGDGSTSYGVLNTCSAPKNMIEIIAAASGGEGSNSFGMRSDQCNTSGTVIGLTATASGGGSNYGLFVLANSLNVQRCALAASGGSTNYGAFNGGALTINGCQVTGTNTVYNMPSVTTLIGASQLNGGLMAGYGTATCAGVYDENYIFYADSCP